MRCPFCQAEDTKVVDSRLVHDGMQVRRRRICQACGERFTTYEVAALSLPRVIKRDGNRERFDVDKLRRGILRALEKRPVDSETVERMIHGILRQLMSEGVTEVPASQIGERVMEALKEVDQVAYVRFASVYRAFQDVEAFRDEVERLMQQTTSSGEIGQ